MRGRETANVWRSIAAAALAMLLPAAAASQQDAAPTPAADEEAELAALLAVLEQETEVATKTRMNADYVPGIVTVLEGEELEALGVETVWEALALVPGIQPTRGATPSLLVRGIQFPFNSGNVKILLDGVPLTRQSSGVNGAILYLPVEQVERIEVIRGPGSVIYGDFAFMGLVNILTRKEGTRLHLRADGDEMRAGGARVAFGRREDPWQLSVNLAAMADDDADVPAPRRAEEERGTGVLSLRRGAFALSGQVIDRELVDRSPAGTPGPAANFDEESWALEGRWERDLAAALRLAARGGALGSQVRSGNTEFDDELGRLAVDLTWEGWTGHSWLAGLEYTAQDIEHATQRLAAPPGQPQPVLTLDGRERNVASALLQDRLDLGERWSVTAGARWDDYSDVGSRVTPRLSLVWRGSERHILKAQYAEGFRAPTFFEAYGPPRPNQPPTLNRNLDFEVNATTELNYVYRRPRATGRATLFHSDLEDMIFGGVPRFANSRRAEAQGVELEWAQQLGERVKLLANLSRVETTDTRGPTLREHDSEAAPDWMADLALLVRPLDGVTAALHWYHVEERPLLAGDEGYDLVDVTATARDLPLRGLDLRLGVKNALDDEIVYVTVPPTGILGRSVFDRRTVWAQLAWRR